MHRRGWPVIGGVAVVALTVLALSRPTVAAIAVGVVGVGVASALLRQRHIFAIAVIGALTVAVLIPATAVAAFPLGSFYPGLIATYFILLGILKGRKRLRRPRLLIPLVLYYVVVLASSALSATFDPFYVLIALLGPIVYWLIRSASNAETHIARVGVIYIAVAEAILALIEAATGAAPLLGTAITISAENPFIAGVHRAQGTAGHPLVLSFLLVVGIALVLMRSDDKMKLGWLFAPVLVAGIIASGSTSSVLAAALLIAIWFLYRARFSARVFALLIASAVALVVLSTEIAQSVLGGDLTERTVGHRMNSIAAVPNLIFQRDVLGSLFGNGTIDSRDLYEAGIFRNDGFYAIDNQIVTSLAHAGIVGLFFLATFCIMLFIQSRPSYRPLLIALLFMTVSFDFLSWLAATISFFIVAGLAPVPEKSEASPDPSSSQLRALKRASVYAKAPVVSRHTDPSDIKSL